MTSKKLIVALVLLLSATSISLAQSQRNCGAAGKCNYGTPYSGSAAYRHHR